MKTVYRAAVNTPDGVLIATPSYGRVLVEVVKDGYRAEQYLRPDDLDPALTNTPVRTTVRLAGHTVEVPDLETARAFCRDAAEVIQRARRDQ